jgi:hypothetical protein
MHIQDFHSKLTSKHEGGALFEALRSLSRIEDPTTMFGVDVDAMSLGEWPQWPSLDAHASESAS